MWIIRTRWRPRPSPTIPEYVYTSLYFRNTGRTTTLQHGSEGQQTVTTRERYVDGELENSMVVDVTTTRGAHRTMWSRPTARALPFRPLTGPDGTTNAPVLLQPGPYGQGHRLLFQDRQGLVRSGPGLRHRGCWTPVSSPYGTLLYITSTDGSFVYGYAVATDTGIAVQNGRILVDLFYETYAESVINGAIQVNVYVVG